MSKSITCFGLCALLFVLCLSAEAQQPAKIYRIGYLLEGSASGTAHLLKAFRQGMRDLGYIDGKNYCYRAPMGRGKRTRAVPRSRG